MARKSKLRMVPVLAALMEYSAICTRGLRATGGREGMPALQRVRGGVC